MLPQLLNMTSAICTVGYGLMTKLDVRELVKCENTSPRPSGWPIPTDSIWADSTIGEDSINRAWTSLQSPELPATQEKERSAVLLTCGRPRCWTDVVAASTAAVARKAAAQKKVSRRVEAAAWASESCQGYAASVLQVRPRSAVLLDVDYEQDEVSASDD